MSGKLNLVSVGPGFANLTAPMAEAAIKESEFVVGYELYLNWIKPWLAGKTLLTPPLTQERERADAALQLARDGKTVSVVSSGDIGIYAMASLVFEQMLESDTFDLRVIPGITAANSCASLLGAPLSHDFATLSLSDLLCPWNWIEHRAKAIAQADLAAVLYNVQSKNRREGVYKILKIFLEHKSPSTVCGVVRNAYRPEQTTLITTLAQLLDEHFDMFTTIIIGNRFTKQKRDWIFTPRGYNSWLEANEKVDLVSVTATALPTDAVWLFSGTGDGNALANEIARQGFKVVISVASEYGKQVAEQSCPGIHVVSGRLGAARRRDELKALRALAVVDATHPFAENISKQLIEICQEIKIPYTRFERVSMALDGTPILVDSLEQSIEESINRGKRIFLATGTKHLEKFTLHPSFSERLWFMRVLPELDSLQHAIKAGIPAQRICAMQGPFSQAFNESLWKEWQIDCVVTKESGAAGGLTEKINAAKALDIPLIIIRRPKMDFPVLANDFQSVLQQLKTQEVLCKQ